MIRKTAFAVLFMLASVVTAFGQSYTLAPDPYQWVRTTADVPVPNGCVWTYQAGTTTAVATYADNAGTPNGNPIIADNYGRFVAYLVQGQSYKFTFESTPCSAPSTHGTVLKVQDNIQAVPSAAGNVDVSGIAGEALTAGACAYLSDGSGSKTPGSWYKCDSTNTYSSTTPEVGFVVSNVSIAGTGQFRLAGSVTGLTSLSNGAEYYVSTAGAITSTAPVIKRHVGHADSTTSLVVSADPPPIGIVPVVDDFRVSAATTNCIPSSDVTASTTIFFTPCFGDRVTLASTTGGLEICSATEKSIAVPATTTQMYDIWVYDSTFGSCTVTLEVLAWTNDTTRATGIARTTVGFYTKSGDLSRRYVGSFRTTGSSGQTEDSLAKRYVWNYYNRSPRPMRVAPTTDSWNQGDATIRQANSTATNQLDFIIGVSDQAVEGIVIGSASSNSVNSVFMVGIGEDSTTTFDAQCLIGPQSGFNAGTPMVTVAQLRKYSAVGRHFWSWNEKGAIAVATVWYGDFAGNGTQSGIQGTVWG